MFKPKKMIENECCLHKSHWHPTPISNNVETCFRNLRNSFLPFLKRWACCFTSGSQLRTASTSASLNQQSWYRQRSLLLQGIGTNLGVPSADEWRPTIFQENIHCRVSAAWKCLSMSTPSTNESNICHGYKILPKIYETCPSLAQASCPNNKRSVLAFSGSLNIGASHRDNSSMLALCQSLLGLAQISQNHLDMSRFRWIGTPVVVLLGMFYFNGQSTKDWQEVMILNWESCGWSIF